MSSSFDNYGRPQSATSTQSNKSSNVTEVQVFPTEAIPIIFLPGILGSPLRSHGRGEMMYAGNPWAWFPDFEYDWVGGFHPVTRTYSDLSPAERKRLLDPAATEALGRYDQDIEAAMIKKIKKTIKDDFSYNQFKISSGQFLSIQEALRRGWATVYWKGYGVLLSTLEKNLRYITYSADPYNEKATNSKRGTRIRLASAIQDALNEVLTGEDEKFRPALKKNFPDIDPENATAESYMDALSPLLKEGRKYHYPVFAVGYNWVQSNNASAQYVYEQIQEIIQYIERDANGSADPKKGNAPPAPNSGGLGWSCNNGIIVVTHSMGGLVGRVLAKNYPDLNIRGVVHSAQPCDGSATLYARMKGGWEGGMAGLALASVGDELMPVLTQSPGATELSPNQNYGANWLRIYNAANNQLIGSFPKLQADGKCDPYREIYLQKDVWWKLGDVALMDPEPEEGVTEEIIWEDYEKIVKNAKKFHTDLDDYYHPNTYMFYGNSPKYKTWGTINWVVGFYSKDNPRARHEHYAIQKILSTKATSSPIRRGYLGAAQMSLENNTIWAGEPRAYMRDAETHGDGTVPFNSANPWQAKGRVWEADAENANPMSADVPQAIQYTFEYKNKSFEHSESYKPTNALNVTFYALLNIIGTET